MDVIGVGPETNKSRRTFFNLIFGNARGIVCLAFMSADRKNFHEEFFKFPEDMEVMLNQIDSQLVGNNIYFCPQLLRERKRTKENVDFAHVAWADLDTCPPSLMLVEPTIKVETSPGRWHAYWVMDKDYDIDEVEDLSRRIAYKHADQGADRSGWDLTQLLRVPLTYNYKYQSSKNTPAVLVTEIVRSRYRMEDFQQYPASPEYSKVDLPLPEEEDLPKGSGEDVLQTRRLGMNPYIWTLFSEEPVSDWSNHLWRLLMLLYESGFERSEVFAIARDAKCNKYARDRRPMIQLWKDVVRAEGRAAIHAKMTTPPEVEMVGLLTDEERELVKGAPETFVERYIAWASKLGDAAPQYHQAGAFVVLSSLLAGSVRLPSTFGTFVPNLWFMILADTTLTRKTTAMDLAMDLVTEVNDDILMATDGSLEGLLTTLATRSGRPSVFLRDEFSGLLEQITKKDYMAGMPEMFTKLYDGKMQKRVLKKEVIEVRDPRLIIFAGGIKNKITSLLSFDMVSSGFMPRFVFITAESDMSRLRPIGPPTQRTTGDRDAILAELMDLYKHYDRTQQLRIERLKATITQPLVTECEMTDDAWVRYNKLEAALLQIGLNSFRPDIMTPIGDRLAKSLLKAAMLIATSRQRAEDMILIEEIDILRAIMWGEQWKAHGQEVMDNIGKSVAERQFDNIVSTACAHPEGISRSTIMQNYHLTARDTTVIFETLEQRSMIRRQKVGKAEMIFPSDYALKQRENKQ